jgi:hypothetical protein
MIPFQLAAVVAIWKGIFSPQFLLALTGWLLLAASRGRDYASPS